MAENPQRWLVPAAIVLTLILAGGYWLLNRPYGETSGEGYEYAVALFSACNRQDDARLARISDMISISLEEGELRPNEAKWLSSIVDKGLAGKWNAASRDVRRLMEDQVKRAASLPKVE